MECQYSLMTFGIPMDDFPVNANGQLRMEPYLRQVVFRQEQEQHLEAMERQKTHHILAPSPVDVLCGRGKPYQGKKIGHVFVVFFFSSFPLVGICPCLSMTYIL